ncbi:MAG TPA: transcriptional regulator [Rhodobacteraceae bacterium]|nr:transcriptional regulator [Paracoccaceae bacterium]
MTDLPTQALPQTSGQRDDSLLANVALLYYKEGLNQGEIAKRMGVSRATIVNYLREGRDRGIVDIRVKGEVLALSRESRDLCEKYGLEDAYVANIGEGEDAALALRQTARAAAMALHNILEPGDRIGVAWGETVKLVADDLPARHIPGTEVCQVIGSMDTQRLLAAETCAIQIANRLGAECHTLHAPAVLSSPALAQSLRAEPTIRTQLDRLKTLDAIITSVGDLADSGHIVTAGIATLDEVHQVSEADGAGFICSRFVNTNGESMALPIEERLIAIELDDIRRTPKRILVASGLNKLTAVRAVIAAGYVTHAIVDSNLAHALIADDQ